MIIDCLRTKYGIRVQELTRLCLGADKDAAVYKAGPYFIKLKKYFNPLGVTIPLLLSESGIKQMLPPLKTIHGEPVVNLDGLAMIVYPFIVGEDGFKRPLTNSQWSILGEALRKIHGFSLPSTIQMKRETYSPKRLKGFYAEPKDEIASEMLKFIKGNAKAIKRLEDRTEELAIELKKQPPACVLCHSDIHGGNVLLTDNEALYIVDFDDPIMAPKERDLMFIGGGVANVWNQPHEEELFYRGYGEVEINRPALAYYRHARIVEDIAEYSQLLLETGPGGADKQVLYEHFLGMFKPNGVIEIAFRT